MLSRRQPLRLRLALLYAGPFIASGLVVLIVAAGAVSSTRVSSPAGSGGTPGPVAHDTGLDSVVIGAIAGLVVMIAVSLVLGWLVAGRFLRPLRTITATARDISASNLHRRLPLAGGVDELTELGATLNELFGRLEASFESQRHFVANASHELRTPLTAERTLLQVALADPRASADTLRAACEQVLALGAQQERLIDALLTLATGQAGVERPEPLDLAEIAGEVVPARRPEAGRRGIEIETALHAAPAAGDPRLVQSLVANLVDNAVRHNRADGRVEISTFSTGGRASISVRNTGPVVPAGEIERLLQPFQQLGGARIRRGGDAEHGHGLGLAIVHAIGAAHGAALTLRAQPDGGLAVHVTFPPADRGLPALGEVTE